MPLPSQWEPGERHAASRVAPEHRKVRRRQWVSGTVSDVEEKAAGRVLLVGLASLGFVAVAVAAELAASLWANSEVPGWSEWAPIAWPQAARATWWTLVALAAWTYRRSLARVGLSRRPVVTALTVTPFVVFAVGTAVGAEWATWH